jgi:hypothetical protein
MTSSPRSRIEQWFPNLRPEEYEITCPEEDPTYNCIAWAAGSTDAWWEPSTNPTHFWPDYAPRNDRIDSLVQVFKGLGFVEWEDENDGFEEGYEKVAIYGKDDTFEHAARQLPEKRKWTSKLGVYEVIEHDNVYGLTGERYGLVMKVLRRAIAQPTAAKSELAEKKPTAAPEGEKQAASAESTSVSSPSDQSGPAAVLLPAPQQP